MVWAEEEEAMESLDQPKQCHQCNSQHFNRRILLNRISTRTQWRIGSTAINLCIGKSNEGRMSAHTSVSHHGCPSNTRNLLLLWLAINFGAGMSSASAAKVALFADQG
jgi:hypothetical protein